jgi:hypothetical protein
VDLRVGRVRRPRGLYSSWHGLFRGLGCCLDEIGNDLGRTVTGVPEGLRG